MLPCTYHVLGTGCKAEIRLEYYNLLNTAMPGESALRESQGNPVQGEQCAGEPTTQYESPRLCLRLHPNQLKPSLIVLLLRLSTAPSLSAEMSTANFTTSWSSSRLAVSLCIAAVETPLSWSLNAMQIMCVLQESLLTQISCSWATMWTVVTTASKLSPF